MKAISNGKSFRMEGNFEWKGDPRGPKGAFGALGGDGAHGAFLGYSEASRKAISIGELSPKESYFEMKVIPKESNPKGKPFRVAIECLGSFGHEMVETDATIVHFVHLGSLGYEMTENHAKTVYF